MLWGIARGRKLNGSVNYGATTGSKCQKPVLEFKRPTARKRGWGLDHRICDGAKG